MLSRPVQADTETMEAGACAGVEAVLLGLGMLLVVPPVVPVVVPVVSPLLLPLPVAVPADKGSRFCGAWAARILNSSIDLVALAAVLEITKSVHRSLITT